MKEKCIVLERGLSERKAFYTHLEAAFFLNCTRQAVSGALKNGKTICGWKIKEAPRYFVIVVGKEMHVARRTDRGWAFMDQAGKGAGYGQEKNSVDITRQVWDRD